MKELIFETDESVKGLIETYFTDTSRHNLGGQHVSPNIFTDELTIKNIGIFADDVQKVKVKLKVFLFRSTANTDNFLYYNYEYERELKDAMVSKFKLISFSVASKI